MSTTQENVELLARIKRLEEQELFHRQALSDILTFSTRLTRNLNLKTLYRESNFLAQKILKLDYSTLMILSNDKKSLIIRDAIGFPSSMIDTFTLVEGQGLSTYVVKEQKPAIVKDFQTEDRFEVPSVVFKEKIVSALAVPMMIMEDVFGVMIGHSRTIREFSSEEINLYLSIANQSAVAIKNVMHFESLQKSEKRFRSLIDQAVDTIIIHDMEGNLLDVNKSACESLGYSREELLQLNVKDVDPGAASKNDLLTIWNKIPQSKSVTIEGRHQRKDGTTFPVEVRVGLLQLDDQQVLLALARDISKRKKQEKEKKLLEKQLRQTQKMEAIGTMAGGIAHDFNNILAIILGNADIAKDDIPKEHPASRNIGQILEASNRAKDLVKQILTFSRKADLQPSIVTPCSTIKESLKLLRSTTPTSVCIQQDLCKESCKIMADPTQFHQLLMNLFSNAIHAMDEKGTLSVRVKMIDLQPNEIPPNSNLKPGKHLKIMVSDTGSGMDREILDRIFDPFFTTKDVDEGTGMGLSIVHGIVKNHNGYIDVESELGEGTTFSILFPTIEDISIKEPKEIVQEYPGGNERILFIDDEEMLAEMGQLILERQGYSVTAKTSSTDALETFKKDPQAFDLVITDQSMPYMTGSELSSELLSLRPDIPIILCTGYSKKMSEETAKELGIKAFCNKPLDIKSLATVVRRVLD